MNFRREKMKQRKYYCVAEYTNTRMGGYKKIAQFIWADYNLKEKTMRQILLHVQTRLVKTQKEEFFVFITNVIPLDEYEEIENEKKS